MDPIIVVQDHVQVSLAVEVVEAVQVCILKEVFILGILVLQPQGELEVALVLVDVLLEVHQLIIAKLVKLDLVLEVQEEIHLVHIQMEHKVMVVELYMVHPLLKDLLEELVQEAAEYRFKLEL